MSGTYSFMDVTATLVGAGGVIDLGYGSAVAEEGITVSRNGNKNTMTIGADGEGMHSLHADKSGSFTVRLLKNSPVNSKLMALYNVQSLSSSAWGQNVISINQTVSGDKIVGRSVAFQKVPDIRYAKEGDILEWVFESIKIDSLLGEF